VKVTPGVTRTPLLLGASEDEIPVAGLFVLRDGRIALWRDYFDLATYRRQTGPAPAH